jgi:hypothetical protein
MPCRRRYADSSNPSCCGPRGRRISATVSTIAPCGGARPRGKSSRARSSNELVPNCSTRTGTRSSNGLERAGPVTTSRAFETRPISPASSLRSSSASLRLPNDQPARRIAAASTAVRPTRTTRAKAASVPAASGTSTPDADIASGSASPVQSAPASRCEAGIRAPKLTGRPASSARRGAPARSRARNRARPPRRRLHARSCNPGSSAP